MGELYLNFWIPGIVVGMLLVGVIMRAVYHWLITGVGSDNIAGAVLFATLSNNFLLGGNFSNSAPALGLRILPMLAILLFVTGIPSDVRQWASGLVGRSVQAD